MLLGSLLAFNTVQNSRDGSSSHLGLLGCSNHLDTLHVSCCTLVRSTAWCPTGSRRAAEGASACALSGVLEPHLLITLQPARTPSCTQLQLARPFTVYSCNPQVFYRRATPSLRCTGKTGGRKPHPASGCPVGHVNTPGQYIQDAAQEGAMAHPNTLAVVNLLRAGHHNLAARQLRLHPSSAEPKQQVADSHQASNSTRVLAQAPNMRYRTQQVSHRACLPTDCCKRVHHTRVVLMQTGVSLLLSCNGLSGACVGLAHRCRQHLLVERPWLVWWIHQARAEPASLLSCSRLSQRAKARMQSLPRM